MSLQPKYQSLISHAVLLSPAIYLKCHSQFLRKLLHFVQLIPKTCIFIALSIQSMIPGFILGFMGYYATKQLGFIHEKMEYETAKHTFKNIMNVTQI